MIRYLLLGDSAAADSRARLLESVPGVSLCRASGSAGIPDPTGFAAVEFCELPECRCRIPGAVIRARVPLVLGRMPAATGAEAVRLSGVLRKRRVPCIVTGAPWFDPAVARGLETVASGIIGSIQWAEFGRPPGSREGPEGLEARYGDCLLGARILGVFGPAPSSEGELLFSEDPGPSPVRYEIRIKGLLGELTVRPGFAGVPGEVAIAVGGLSRRIPAAPGNAPAAETGYIMSCLRRGASGFPGLPGVGECAAALVRAEGLTASGSGPVPGRVV